MNRASWALAGAAAAGMGVGVYAFLLEPRWLEVKRVSIHIRDLHRDLEGLRIGLLTDLHGEGRRSMRLIRRACRAITAESPAIVAVTGDLANRRMPSFRPVLDAIACLNPPMGVFAVPGNHDHRRGIERFHRELREHSAIVDLTNRSLILRVGNARLCLAGVDDLAEGQPSLASLPGVEERDLTILLAHNPDQAERARRQLDRVDLVLSGHTHGGQIRIPGMGPVRTSVDHPDLYEEGLRRRPWTQVYVSRGLGTVHVHARLATRPEVTLLELTRAPRPPRTRATEPPSRTEAKPRPESSSSE